jgi:hypothetical protein
VLKPVAARLAETSWPARPGFARGAGIAADPEKTPESDEREHSGRRRRGDARVAGRRSALHDRRYHRVTGVAGASPAAFKSDESNDRVKRDRHDERRRSRSMRKRSLRRDVPVPAAKQDLRDAAAHSRDSPEAGSWSDRHPWSRRGDGVASLRSLSPRCERTECSVRRAPAPDELKASVGATTSSPCLLHGLLPASPQGPRKLRHARRPQTVERGQARPIRLLAIGEQASGGRWPDARVSSEASV